MEINKKLLFILFIVLVSFGVYNKVKAEEDPYPLTKIPVFSGAYNLEMFINKPEGTKSINYLIKIKYPAIEVLEFYDEQFKQMGYRPSFYSRFGKREWEYFTDGTRKEDPKVRQLISLWFNPEVQAEAVLVMRYEKEDKKWGSELFVLCQIQPIIKTEKLDKFLEKLKLLNQYGKFMKLLDLYRMPNGKVDLEKALKENPDNDYLMEYKAIIDEMKKKRKK